MSDQEVIADSSQIQTSMSENVPKMAKYMKFIGILEIIGGAIYCLTIIGALIGVPVIYMGIRMREAAEGFKKYLSSDSKQDLNYAIDRQTRFFFIQFVLAIIALAFLGIYLIVIIGLLASGALF
jgi:hypothetical protein